MIVLYCFSCLYFAILLSQLRPPMGKDTVGPTIVCPTRFQLMLQKKKKKKKKKRKHGEQGTLHS